ncbi:MAG: acyl-ACP--UDP-N-acetylglucosamine O-acyltransferase [Rhodocyclaceae bacterium]|nr:acyl-ACP--UDP-N-acetylglucosamine O-acyltransferase [Rhodocyclaceae bacterium]MBP6110137.1 acyl-ACP--UDP-N-acetylglucosamine O-acyltransferase [Rhodocyclaceae bacterium]MBP6279306.1 acyl-ACP--UDP-N-acetylglucosamine O-acyltransferase [Rhodocyclaceae bacterium]
MTVHATAIVHPNARIAEGVTIGAYSIVGEHVEIGANTWVGPHVVIEGDTRIGADNRFFQFCSVGAAPQDKKYAGEATRLEIGDRNTFRESCTINRGTTQDRSLTTVGNDNWVMAYVHIAHDCVLGSNIILANSTQLAGHVHIGDWVILGGITGVHQFVHIGAHSMTAFGSMLAQDLPPYVMAFGNPAEPRGINAEGLKRRGFSAEAIAAIRHAFKTLYRKGLLLDDAKSAIAEEAKTCAELLPLSEFLQHSGRGIIR